MQKMTSAGYISNKKTQKLDRTSSYYLLSGLFLNAREMRIKEKVSIILYLERTQIYLIFKQTVIKVSCYDILVTFSEKSEMMAIIFEVSTMEVMEKYQDLPISGLEITFFVSMTKCTVDLTVGADQDMSRVQTNTEICLQLRSQGVL